MSLLAGLATALALAAAHGHALAASVQTVSSTEGRYAWGIGGGPLSKDSNLRFVTFFSRAEGVTAGGPAAGRLDLARPLGWLELYERGPVIAPNTHEWTQLCNRAENVTSYDVGRMTKNGGEPAWAGLWFDVGCRALGYDFFRVHVDPAGTAALRQFAAADSEKPATTGDDATYGVSEEQAQEIAFEWAEPYWNHLTRSDMPRWAPISAPEATLGLESDPMYQYRQGWGGPTGQTDWGQVVAHPLEHQSATVTVCGYREGREPRCFGSGGGDVFPSTAGMTQTTHSP